MEISAFTILRGICALWVVLLHYSLYTNVGKAIHFGLLGAVFKHGYLGVDIFFTLSGYILAYRYSQPTAWAPKTIKDFFIRRFARIYPMYVFSLLILIFFKLTGILTPFVQQFGSYSNKNLTYSLFMVQSWHLQTEWTWNMPAWSVSIEWFLYCFFPFFITYYKKINKNLLLPTTISMYIILIGYLVVKPNMLFWGAMKSGLVRGTVEFSIGILFYRMHQQGQGAFFHRTKQTVLVTVIALLVMLHFEMLLPLSLTLATLTVFLLPSIKVNSVSKTHQLLIFLGKRSYSIFILQFPAQIIFNQLTSAQSNFGELKLVLFILQIALLITISHFAYKHIENPLRIKITRMNHQTIKAETKASE
jgi:peptidoglycan/LPS O-acetylase OafA/YrhL